MNFLILFNAKKYVVVPIGAGVNPNRIVEEYPGYATLDTAISEEEASIKIREDRERNKPVWV